MEARIIGVVGWSGSGKTTLLETLLPKLISQGLRVNVIKHAHHDVVLEPPHKDSARMRAAGAYEVMLASPYRYVLAHELNGGKEPSLMELVGRMQPADLTLVEGYRWEPFRKLEVYRPSVGKPPIYPDDKHIAAVASDAPPPEGNHPVWLNLNQPDQVMDWLLSNR